MKARRDRYPAGGTKIRLHDPGPKDSAMNQGSSSEMVTPQVEFVSGLSPDSPTDHHGRYFDAVVQLKIIGSSLSERGNTFEGFVVKPPITGSEK